MADIMDTNSTVLTLCRSPRIKGLQPFHGILDTLSIIIDPKKQPRGSDINIELFAADVDTNIDLLCVHRISYLGLAIRARGSYDYSSYAE